MITFINYLKLIATVLITNSHFDHIWPVRALASGGLLGNVIFFAVSGFLLYNIKLGFTKWFSKRFFRVYPAMAVFTLFAVAIGRYPLDSFQDAFGLFVYPTNYIFLVWLIVCYCVFYVVVYLDKKYEKFLETSMVLIFFAWVLIYVLFYDKSIYRVDNVSEPFILFLYIESMLLGAFFKKNQIRFGEFQISKVLITIICLIAYFCSKILFSKIEALLNFQIVNQFIIFIALFFTFDLFMSLEGFFKSLPEKINCCVKYISNITLQIYIVQFVIIYRFEKLAFPLNFVTVVLLILVVASLLYYLEVLIRKAIAFISDKVKKG